MKPRYRVRANSWVPPTAAGVARWRKLLEAAETLERAWERNGFSLANAVAAIQRDPYPTRDKDNWAILHQWVAAARAFLRASSTR